MYIIIYTILTFPEHMSSPPVFSAVRVARSLVFYAVFCRLLFVLFLLASDYPLLASDYPLLASDYPVGV